MAINFGGYDPNGLWINQNWLAIEHVFVDWSNYIDGTLTVALNAINGRNRFPLVTLDPWANASITPVSSDLLADVIEGLYDTIIYTIANDLLDYTAGSLYLCWGRDMDRVTGRYPWAVINNSQYIAAYQHVLNIIKSVAMNVQFIWSPRGHTNAASYYPGDGYCDYLGMSIYGFPQYEMDHYTTLDKTLGKPTVKSFDYIMSKKYQYLKQITKPIVIREMGITGSHETQRHWLNQAFVAAANYPIKSMVYFNSFDTPGVWDDPSGLAALGKTVHTYGTVNWETSPAIFRNWLGAN